MPIDESTDSQYLALARKYEDTAKMVARHYCHRDGYEYESLLCALTTHLWKTFPLLPADLDDSEKRAWVYSVLSNKACDMIRQEQRLHSHITFCDRLPDMAEEDDESYVKRLYELIEMLDINDKEVLSMYLEGKTMAEIGKSLGGSEQRALRRMKKIREKLRELNEKTR